MHLSKKTLAKFCAYHRTGNSTYGNSRFAENEDGGVIYMQHHRLYADTEITIFAITKGKDELTPDKLDKLSYCHPLLIVLPCAIINPDLLATLNDLESRWEKYGVKSSIIDEKQSIKHSLRNMFLIYVVADAGKDASTGEKKYAYQSFTTEAIENIIKRELKKQGTPPELDMLSVSGLKMRTILRERLISQGTQVTLRQVNEHVNKAKKRLLTDAPHFEELNGEQTSLVINSVVSLVGNWLEHDVVKAETMRLHGISDCEILDELITDMESIKDSDAAAFEKMITEIKNTKEAEEFKKPKKGKTKT